MTTLTTIQEHTWAQNRCTQEPVSLPKGTTVEHFEENYFIITREEYLAARGPWEEIHLAITSAEAEQLEKVESHPGTDYIDIPMDALNAFTKMSDKIRFLLTLGMERKDVASFLKIRYQQVYQTYKRMHRS